jgi:thioredoxin:protein disulfide reductase
MKQWTAFAGILLLAAPAGVAQDSGAPPPGAAVVKPHAYVSLAPVPRGKTFELAVVADIRQGFHMNSHQPTDEFLIPTTLTPQLPRGVRQIEAIYPPGEMRKFSFSKTPLSVYTGSVKLLLRMEAAADAPLGPQTIPLTLRYQACNDTACLPPAKVPVEVKLQIAAAGAATQSANPEIFAAQKAPPKK